LGSMNSTSLGGTSSNSLQPQSLNQALARVNNKWDREQRKHDQEATRKLTLLKQRKISAVLKVGLSNRAWIHELFFIYFLSKKYNHNKIYRVCLT
jgi:hypothetical protein